MKTLLSALFCLSVLVLSAQRQDANWVFGYHCGMKFDTSGSVNNFGTSTNTREPAASISDNVGNLLFYVGPVNPSDFDSPFYIYGANHQPIENGDSILLNLSSTNGAIFIEAKQNQLYYLIHTGANMQCSDSGYICYNLYLTKIALDNGVGVVSEKNILLTNKFVNEKIAITKHANGSDWWLVTQAHLFNEDTLCTNEYCIFEIKENEFFEKSQRIGSSWCEQYSQYGEITFSNSGEKLALAISAKSNLYTFAFDRCNGQLSNKLEINLGTNRFPYGVAYSRNEKVLYVSYGPEHPDKGVLQVYSSNGQFIIDTLWDYQETGSPGQIELGPDDKIYISNLFANYGIDILYNKYMSVVENPDSTGAGCGLSKFSIYVGDSCRTRGGLPNMPNYNLGPLPIYEASAGVDTFYCQGDSTIKALPIGGDSLPNITYLWQSAPGIDSLTARTQLVKPNQSRWYYVTITDTNYIGPSCASRLDSVYVEVRNCDTVGITETQILQAKLYPNPTAGALTVELPNGQGGSIALYNLLGQSVYQSPLNGSQTTVDINLSPGIYLYRISSGGKAVNGKLLVE